VRGSGLSGADATATQDPREWNMIRNAGVCAALIALLTAMACSGTKSKAVQPQPGKGDRMAWTTAVAPKPLSGTVERGLAWLALQQNEDGGWGQGEEAARMRGSDGAPLDRSNVADTCMAALALVRSGSTPDDGPFSGPIARALAFVCGEIEEADVESLYVTDVRGTRVQGKIGNFVDTFLASLLLAETKGRTGEAALDARVDKALAKVLDKIHRHQKQDGGWEGQGWAPVLSLGIGGKAINRAAQAGVDLPRGMLTASEQGFLGMDASSPASAGPSAGVALYSYAGGAGIVQDFLNTNAQREKVLRAELSEARQEEDKVRIRRELDGIAEGRTRALERQDELVARLEDRAFVSGFGSNGGEEFLSYMNISESLVVRADDVWRRWDAAMSDNLNRVQNQDGSWSGHHCITGRTFCTSAALLTLLADRTPVPVEVVKK